MKRVLSLFSLFLATFLILFALKSNTLKAFAWNCSDAPFYGNSTHTCTIVSGNEYDGKTVSDFFDSDLYKSSCSGYSGQSSKCDGGCSDYGSGQIFCTCSKYANCPKKNSGNNDGGGDYGCNNTTNQCVQVDSGTGWGSLSNCQAHCGGGPPPTKVCKPSHYGCNNGKCKNWIWSDSCSVSHKTDCGNCGTGYSCQHSNLSGTNNGGYCHKDPVCNPKNCTNIGAVPPGQANGQEGDGCKKQYDGCGKTSGNVISPICGNCAPGLHCAGGNSKNIGGHCVKDPPPPTYSVRILMFYDPDGNAKGGGTTGTSYTQCWPITATGKPNPSNIAGRINSQDTGGNNQPFSTGKSYLNCKTGGNKNASTLGFVITTNQYKKSVTITNPDPANYQITGYNYSVNGGGRHVCVGNSSNANCSGAPKLSPSFKGNIDIKFGYKKLPEPKQAMARVFVDSNENGRWDNDERCFDSSQDGALTINGTAFSETTGNTDDSDNGDIDSCRARVITNNATANVSLQNIGQIGANNDWYATGFEYYDANSGPTHNPNNCAAGDDVPDDGGLTDPFGCVHDSNDTDNAETASLTGEAEVHFGVKQTIKPSSVSGFIFEDDPPLTFKGTRDQAYKGNPPKTIYAYYVDPNTGDVDNNSTTSDVANNGNGSYTLNDLDPGEYIIQYTGDPPSGYARTYPKNGTSPASFHVAVGVGNCWIEKQGPPRQVTLKDASCTNGNITGLNFGISGASSPWFQAVGGDVRIDKDVTNNVPDGKYALAGVATMSTGVLLTDQSSASLTYLSGKISPQDWLVTNNTYKKTSGGTTLSYDYLLATFNRGSITTTNMFGVTNSPCSGNGPTCNFNNLNNSGVYTRNGDLTINQNTTFPAGNFVFLVNGIIRIQGNITVPVGSTVVFASTGDIRVGANITDIAGIFSTERTFRVGTGNTLLTVEGTVVANSSMDTSAAGLKPNSIDDMFKNARDLGAAGNANGPSVRFTFRPDFMTYLPDALKAANYSVQEIAPGPDYIHGTP